MRNFKYGNNSNDIISLSLGMKKYQSSNRIPRLFNEYINTNNPIYDEFQIRTYYNI